MTKIGKKKKNTMIRAKRTQTAQSPSLFRHTCLLHAGVCDLPPVDVLGNLTKFHFSATTVLVSAGVMPADSFSGAEALTSDDALELLQPLLASREDLLRMQRKSTCWLFFRDVGARKCSGDANGGSETMLACRICRPDVVDLAGWDKVTGSRSGLIRYSDATGTSAMRAHVKNCHGVVSTVLERAVALAIPDDDPSIADEGGALPLGKKRAMPTHDRAACPSPKKRASQLTSDEKSDLWESVNMLEATLNSTACVLSGLKTKLEKL